MIKLRLSPALILAAIVMMMAETSCTSSRTATTAKPRTATRNAISTTKSSPAAKPIPFTIPAHADNTTRRLLTEAKTWLGSPYLYGGSSMDGVDCSGFVLQVYLKALDIKLPRTSAKQQEYCSIIPREQLLAGDLIFFTVRGGDSVGHVGIYIGDGKMVHASSSKGVIVTPISQKYFVDNFHSCGRVAPFVAMREKSISKEQKTSRPKEVAPDSPAMAAKSKNHSPFTTTSAQPAPATAKAMEINRQKALRALLEQVEDSLETNIN